MDRRGFFKQAFGKGLTLGSDRVEAATARFERAAAAARAAMPEAFEPDLARPLHDAAPVTRECSLDDVVEICREAGLELAADDVAAVARRSLRLLPAIAGEGPAAAATAPASDRTRFGGTPDLPPDVAWPRWNDRPLTFLAQLDLAAVAAALGDAVPRDGLTGSAPDDGGLAISAPDDGGLAGGVPSAVLPVEGLLLVFAAVGELPSGWAPGDLGACRVLLVGAEARRGQAAARGPSLPATARGAALSAEWTLPHADVARVRALTVDAEGRAALNRDAGGRTALGLDAEGRAALNRDADGRMALALDADQGAAWERARALLAERQGVSLEDGDELRSVHRLLGDPDERGGEMPLACEFCAGGIEVADRAAYPLADAYRENAARWRLLLQLTVDSQLGWEWGGRRERLYLWAAEDDLAAGLFVGVRALAP